MKIDSKEIKIDSVAKSKEEFYGILKAKIKPGTEFEKKTGLYISWNFFVSDRDYFRGEVGHNYLWVMRPRTFTAQRAQRIFSGVYKEAEDGHVVVYGSFDFPVLQKIMSIVFAAVIALALFMVLLAYPPLPLFLVIAISGGIGFAVWRIDVALDLATSVSSEAAVVRLLRDLKWTK